jgi:lipopolysaccharide/colanic/teichoic acid biosynthesis glycosyltransferase
MAREAEVSADARRGVGEGFAKRVLDVVGAALLLMLLAPVMAVISIAIVIDSPGGVFYRCARVGRHGREFGMLKFRKMVADATGPPLTTVDDDRFTRVGRFLARSKLDEVPQLWNVLKGEMSLVGPRPEAPSLVARVRQAYDNVLEARPGITGLSQLAFAREGEIIAGPDRVWLYLDRILPAKIRLDELYIARRSLSYDLRILAWTVAAVIFRVDAAVHRKSGRISRRRRPQSATGIAETGVAE